MLASLLDVTGILLLPLEIVLVLILVALGELYTMVKIVVPLALIRSARTRPFLPIPRIPRLLPVRKAPILALLASSPQRSPLMAISASVVLASLGVVGAPHLKAISISLPGLISPLLLLVKHILHVKKFSRSSFPLAVVVESPREIALQDMDEPLPMLLVPNVAPRGRVLLLSVLVAIPIELPLHASADRRVRLALLRLVSSILGADLLVVGLDANLLLANTLLALLLNVLSVETAHVSGT